jgi:hypothetical protein
MSVEAAQVEQILADPASLIKPATEESTTDEGGPTDEE